MKPYLYIPFHPLLFAIYPIVTLFATNIHEVSGSVLWRPLLVSLIAAALLLAVLFWISRDWPKAACITSWMIFLFFTYGRLYNYLKSTHLAESELVRHRYLVLLFLALLVLGIWIMLKRIHQSRPLTAVLNGMAMVLLALPVYQISAYTLNVARGEQAASNRMPASGLDPTVPIAARPDVYYIILDSYTRSDVLLKELGFDNSDFIGQLEELGFYVADCSRSNYNKTQNSTVSSLNMEYMPELFTEASAQELAQSDTWLLIKPSAVRHNFESLGYKIVAFDTGFKWTSIDDADLYLSRGRYAFGVQSVNPFEQMLIDSTILSIYGDFARKASWDQYSDDLHPQANYIGLEEFILDQLPKVADISEPTFTYAHINITHEPYVFSPEGYLYDSDEMRFPDGYIHAIRYINEQMLSIIGEILVKSSLPPIIIIQADHGYWLQSATSAANISPILNAYYLPGVQSDLLYPQISPVNTFRLIFNETFGGHYDLLPDISYDSKDVNRIIPEENPECLK